MPSFNPNERTTNEREPLMLAVVGRHNAQQQCNSSTAAAQHSSSTAAARGRFSFLVRPCASEKQIWFENLV
jgi:hypothetical protein